MLNTQTETTDMAFLIDQTEEIGQVLAIMPAHAATVGRPNHCTCYVHVGQHGACDLDAALHYYDEASPDEYADLKAELEGLGYNVRVVSKVVAIFDRKYKAARRRGLGL